MAERKKIQGFANDRATLIDDLIKELDKKVTKAQEKLYISLFEDVISKLDIDGERIRNTQRNRRLLNSIDTIFNTFGKNQGIQIANELINSIDKVISFNAEYFTVIGGADVIDIEPQVRKSMNEWLGIEKGTLKTNGYLDKILQDGTVRNQVKDLAIKNIITQNGLAETTKQLSRLINGLSEAEAGSLQKYYKNFAYDTIAISDRVVGMEYANANGYECAVYEGGLIESSRLFCIERNGKVFHKSEIAKFNPPSAKPPNYNPFIDLGGFRCRHYLNWITNKLAIYLRPNIKELLTFAS